MTKFDEAPSSDGWRWLRPVGRQPGVFIASIVAIGLVVSVAAAVLLAAEAARVQVARLVGGTQFAAVLGSQVTRVDAEAMRGSLEAIPLVGAVRLQTREQALTRLVDSSSLVGGPQRNPLPDLWVLTVREPDTDAALRSFADDRACLEQTLTAMPGVASVRVDREWVGFVDRWVATALRTLPAVHGVTLGALATIVFCIAFVAGRTFGTDGQSTGVGPAIVFGASAALLGIALAAALGAAIGNVVDGATLERAGLQPVLRAGLDSPLVGLVAAALVASAVGTLVGRWR